MKKCYNCGAEINDHSVECPYCHATQHEAAENKYMDDLYSMNHTMNQVHDSAIKNELKTTLKRTFILFCIYAVCITIGAFMGIYEYKSPLA